MTGAHIVEDDQDRPGIRPQSLLLAFFGAYLLGREVCVATGSVLDVLGRVGVSEQAARSTLSRMARRGLLRRERTGRKVYLGLTKRSHEILVDGEARIWRHGVVHEQWDGSWTVLAFSMPESWQRQRHVLRSRLLWAGFGGLQGGMWIAPGAVDVPALLDGLEGAEHVRAFQARAVPPTDVTDMVDGAWDLDALAARYRAFLGRWDLPDPAPEATDDLARHLLLNTEWLQIIRSDPRLPPAHLPDTWPAPRAQRAFREHSAALEPAARAIAADVLDTIPDENAHG